MARYWLEPVGAGWLLDESRIGTPVAGNKVRKLAHIVARRPPDEGIMTVGSPYSSHVLAVAEYARRASKAAILVIIGEEPVDLRAYPHLYLAREFGADLRYCSDAAAYGYIEALKREFPRYLWVPGGGHLPEAAEAYEGLLLQVAAECPSIRACRWIVVPFGTGTTAFGLAMAARKLGLDATVLGVSVSRTRDQCLAALSQFPGGSELDLLEVDDTFAGRYVEIGPATQAARWRYFQESGVLVDPIYNAKSLCVMYQRNLRDVLVVNTGGALNNLL